MQTFLAEDPRPCRMIMVCSCSLRGRWIRVSVSALTKTSFSVVEMIAASAGMGSGVTPVGSDLVDEINERSE